MAVGRASRLPGILEMEKVKYKHQRDASSVKIFSIKEDP